MFFLLLIRIWDCSHIEAQGICEWEKANDDFSELSPEASSPTAAAYENPVEFHDY